MIRLLALSTLLLTLSACIGSGDNSDIKRQGDGRFPSLKGINLMGEERPIPQSLNGDYNIIVVAFEREQQENVDTWLPNLQKIEDEYDDVHYYEIPLIYEMNAVMRGWINNGMRSGIPDEDARKRTITVYTDREEFFDIMDMNKDTIYTLLLDNKGKIMWRESGDATREKIIDLRTTLDKALQQ